MLRHQDDSQTNNMSCKHVYKFDIVRHLLKDILIIVSLRLQLAAKIVERIKYLILRAMQALHIVYQSHTYFRS